LTSETVYYGPVVRDPWKYDSQGAANMAWTKPEFTVVAVTLEVTAYAGKK
jgi:coenzyme PQQ precursor peptide PqqA